MIAVAAKAGAIQNPVELSGGLGFHITVGYAFVHRRELSGRY
jgi:hypothetical protein